MRGLKGKVVIVTGGAGGIGAAICRRFGEEGASVAVFDINQDAAEKVAAASGPVAAAPAPSRSTSPARIRSPMPSRRRSGSWARSPCWSTTPAGTGRKPFTNTESRRIGIEADRGQPVRRPATCTTPCCPAWSSAAGPHRQHRLGCGAVGSSGEAVYAACKGGLVAFSKTHRPRACARTRITVNVVCPGPDRHGPVRADYSKAQSPRNCGPTFTRSIPLGRIGQPDDLPGAILSSPATTPPSSPARCSAFPAA